MNVTEVGQLAERLVSGNMALGVGVIWAVLAVRLFRFEGIAGRSGVPPST